MAQNYRFGRRLPLPSTVQILHELLVMMAQDNAQKDKAQQDNAKQRVANENKSRATKIDIAQTQQVPE
jgi:hypothetical protein